MNRCKMLALAGLLVGGTAAAAPIEVSYGTPARDRWMYTFGSNPGAELEATVFSILGSGFENTFDIRDGQFLVGYDTAAAIPPAQGLNRYRVLEATLTARISRDKVFVHDGTFDALETYLPTTDPRYVADSDAGRPVELYAVGYRNGLSAMSFAETTPFSFGNPAQKSVRNAFAAQYAQADGTGSLIDISNNTQDLSASGGSAPFESRPLAVGACPLAPGALVDINTDFTFSVDVSDPGAIRYLRSSLNTGRLNLMISSLVPTSQQSAVTPAFYTREYPLVGSVLPARLSLRVCVGSPADWNCSGDVTVQDIFEFLAGYFTGSGDVNADGATTVQDIFDFLVEYFAG